MLDNMPSHYYNSLMKELQELVIGWDNIPEALKNELSTANEVVANADYLIHAADLVMEKLQV